MSQEFNESLLSVLREIRDELRTQNKLAERSVNCSEQLVSQSREYDLPSTEQLARMIDQELKDL